MILVSVSFTWLNFVFPEDLFSQLWAGWSFLPARRYSWFVRSCFCSLCWLRAQTVLHHQGNSGLPGKPLLPRAVYDVGWWWQEQLMALLKLQLWGWSGPTAALGSDTCNQCWKNSLDPGLRDSRIGGTVEKLLVRGLDTALRWPLEALPSPSLHSASAAAQGCWECFPPEPTPIPDTSS